FLYPNEGFKNDYFFKKTKTFFYKKQKNRSSNYRLKNYNYTIKMLNVIFKNGSKNTIFKIINNLNEDFYNKFDDDNAHLLSDFFLNLYKLILEKKFYFNLEYLLPLILDNYEFMFNIKENKVFKNVKKLKRKPTENQLI